MLGFEILTPVVMKSLVFWDIATCRPLKVKGCIEVTCRLHFQGHNNKPNKEYGN
jgi:hypothetical protein